MSPAAPMATQVERWLEGPAGRDFRALSAQLTTSPTITAHQQCQRLRSIGNAMAKDPKSPDPLTQSPYFELAGFVQQTAKDCLASDAFDLRFDLGQVERYVGELDARLRELGVAR